MFSPIKNLFHHGEMDCKEVRKLSSDYLDDDVAPAKRSAIHTHLSKCGPCQAFVATLAATIGLLSRLPRVPAPPAFKRTLLERTKRSEEGANSP